MGVRVTGAAELTSDLAALGSTLAELPVMEDVATVAVSLARGFAPKRTGRLRATIKARHKKNKVIVRAGSKRVPYAAAINYGWRKRRIGPSDFFMRTDNALRPKLAGLIAAGVSTTIAQHHL